MLSDNDNQEQLPAALVAGILPFAIAQELGLPCAYERSIKISPTGILPNRYLLAIDTSALSLAQAKNTCARLGMPPHAVTALARRYRRASQFMMGYEEGQLDAVLKVYLETRGQRRPAVLSHVGWKWTVAPTATAGSQRTTLYRRVACSSLEERLAFLQNCLGSPTFPALRLVANLLQREAANAAELICLSVWEDGRCRGCDLNLYPLQLDVESLGESLIVMMAEFGLNNAQFGTVLSLCGSKRLGHLSVGTDYLTIYYLP